MARAAAASKAQSLTASKSALKGRVGQLTGCVRKAGEQVPTMRQKCDHKVDDVLFERDGFQVRLDSTASQLWGGR